MTEETRKLAIAYLKTHLRFSDEASEKAELEIALAEFEKPDECAECKGYRSDIAYWKRECGRLTDMHADAVGRADKLAAVGKILAQALLSVEWVDESVKTGCCPACGVLAEEHAENCVIKQALAAHRAGKEVIKPEPQTIPRAMAEKLVELGNLGGVWQDGETIESIVNSFPGFDVEEKK